jgi:hypothetical protein
MASVLPLVAQVLQQPPTAFDPGRQSLKLWVTYCLRDRGFKVVYAANADFAIESQGEKIYFKLHSDDGSPQELDPSVNWIIWQPSTQTARLQAATA